MDRKEAKELLPIIKAFAEGKVIETFAFNTNEWVETNNPSFDLLPNYYRIKPEPKYRPFKTHEECWAEMHKHPDFGWIRDKEKLSYYPIQEVSDTNHYRNLLNDYEFTDGTPFGVKEE